jgi:hypothetical protein
MNKLFVSLLTTMTLASVAQAQVKVINIGPAVGPTATYAQAFQKNLKGPSEFITAKDCGAAVKMVESNKDSVFLLPHDLITTARKMKDQCWENIDPKNVVVFSEAYYEVCRLPDNKTTLLTPGVKLGRASVHPVKEWGDDFNQQNKASVNSIGLASSRTVLQSLMSKDIDWGVIVRPVALSAINSGQIVCPFDTNDKSERALSKTYKMKVTNFPLSNIMVANTKDPKVMADLRQAAKSADFQQFLKTGEHAYISTDVTAEDMKKFNKAVEELYLYIK